MSIVYCINPEINIGLVKKAMLDNLGPITSGYISKNKIVFDKFSYEKVLLSDIQSILPDEVNETDIICKFIGPWEFCEKFIPAQSYFVKEF